MKSGINRTTRTIFSNVGCKDNLKPILQTNETVKKSF